MIKDCIAKAKANKSRRFGMTREGLIARDNTSKRARKLLDDIIDRVGTAPDLESLVVTGTYGDFWYDHRQHFSRDRKELVDRGLLLIEDQEMFVNPDLIQYMTRRQMDWYHQYFRMTKSSLLYGKGLGGGKAGLKPLKPFPEQLNK